MAECRELWLMWSESRKEYGFGFEDSNPFFSRREECQIECDDANETYKTENDWKPVSVTTTSELTRLRRESEAFRRMRDVHNDLARAVRDGSQENHLLLKAWCDAFDEAASGQEESEDD